MISRVQLEEMEDMKLQSENLKCDHDYGVLQSIFKV